MADAYPDAHIRLDMLSQPRLLAAARSLVLHFAQRVGFSEGCCGKISLAVDEALCNVINHGYERKDDGRIWIYLWALDGGETPGIRVIIEDRARQVDPSIIKPRSLDDIRPGGLGVHIIREVMDEAKYEQRDGGGMRLTMLKHAKDESSEERSAPADACTASGEAHGS